ncbi:MAG: CHAT domain-containing protein [Phycisphaerae bacterium]|nr:CHAT domain-containing protein [Saprospiraceae bacterium]
MKFFAKSLILFCLLTCARAQGQACLRLLDSLNALGDRGEFLKVEAMLGYVDTLCLQEVGDTDSLYADVLGLHGTIFLVKGNPVAALPWIRRAKALSLLTRGLYNKNTGSLYSAEGIAFAQMGQSAQALADLDTSLLIKKYLRDTSAILGTAYGTRGQILLFMGRYAEAKADLRFAIQNAKANHLDPNSYNYLVRINALGLALTFLGENQEATPVLKESLRIAIGLFGEENMITITCMNNLALNHRGLGKLDTASAIHKKALQLAKKVNPHHPTTHQIRVNLGTVFLSQGRYTEALSLFLEAKTIADKQGGLTPADYATLLSNIASVYFETYDFPSAMLYITEASERMAKTLGKDNPRYAQLNSNLAACHFQMGNIQLARSLAEETFAAVESFGEFFPEYETYFSNMVLSNDDNEGMLIQIDHAKGIVGKKFGEKSPQYGFYLILYAICLSNLGREKEVLPLLKQAEQILQTNKESQSRFNIEAMRNLATCHERLGNTRKSLTYFQKALTLTKESSGHENANYAFLLQGAAGINERRGKLRSAFAYYLFADTLYRRITGRNFAVLSDAGREFFLANIRPQLDHWTSFAWRHAAVFPELPSLLFDDQLSQKGQLLHSARSVLASLRGDSTLEAQMAEWLGLRQTIDVQRGKLAQKDTNALYTTFELDSLSRIVELLESALTQKSKAFAAATLPVDWRDVQTRLAPDEAAVEFFHFRYYKPEGPTDSVLYGALVLRKGDQAPRFIPLFEEKQLLAVLNKKGIGETEWLKKLYPANANEPSKLYQLVWQPLEKEIANVKRVWYSPSGLLHRIAFPVISKAHGERLVENIDLQQVGSTRELATALSEQAEPPKSALIYACVSYPTVTAKMQLRTPECLGDNRIVGPRGGGEINSPPLPNSLSEADTVAAKLREAGVKVEVQIGYQPVEDDVSQIGKIASPDFLMFTTHGFAWDTLPITFKGRFPPHNPMYSSGLLLAGSDTVLVGGPVPPGFREDGILTAREIGDMNLQHTRLAILSACQSGLGEANSSEGVYGLQRAFKIAGTRQVLVTLWEIPDGPDTRDFVGQFTHLWLASGDARRALYETQLEFFRRGKSVQVWGAWALI